MSKNITTIVDQVGRVIIGEVVEDTKVNVRLKNPAIIHIGQNPQTGQIQVQTLPYFFREFLNPKTAEKGTTWSFTKDKIVVGEVDLDERLKLQYEKLFVAAPASAAAPQPAKNASNKGGAEVIKLFDDEDDKK